MNYQGPFDDTDAKPFDAGNYWGDLDVALLGSGRRTAPAFPVGILGPWAEWATTKAKAASAPVDYVAVSLLACTGAAIANVRWPVAGTGWSEPPILWCAQVGDPSSGKSPAMDAAFDLVQFAEARMALSFDDDHTKYVTAKQVAKLAREEWEGEVKQARKSGHVPPDQPADSIEPMPPVRPRIRVADATVEALGQLAANLPRGLLLVRDEVTGWLGAFDKYGGGGSDRAFALEMYGGRSYVVDRVRSPDPLHIRHLSVGVLGGVQPDKLAVIIKGPDDGLAARLLWSWPDAVPEFNLSRVIYDDMPMRHAFARLTDLAMGSDLHGNAEPKRLRVMPAAENILEEFARETSRRCREVSGLFAGALGKGRGHVLRLATVFEHLWWAARHGAAEPEAISAEAMNAATELLEAYFIPMAERVFGDASIPDEERQAMVVARTLQRRRLTTFNARDLRREIGGELRKAADMDRACATLVAGCAIRPKFAREGDRGGRPAKTYEVNPAIWRVAA